MQSQTSKWTAVVVVLMIVFIIVGGGYLYIKSGENLVSPVPREPSFQVIFYTPTPGETTPTSTPSATLKPDESKKAPTSIPKESPEPTGEKEEPTATPTEGVTPTEGATPTP